jgi:hypothetical protein
MVSSLDGWQLATVAIAGIFALGFVLVLVIMREGRSRKVRVGMFVEREYVPETDPPKKSDPSTETTLHDWPRREE